MPPKKLARKYRALHAAHRLAADDSLDDTELGIAFYDQSQLTAATMRKRGKLVGKVSPLVSES